MASRTPTHRLNSDAEDTLSLSDLTLGEQLATQRQKLDLSLKYVENKLKIRHDYLLALEENRYHDLPPLAYALGFVRSYSLLLGFSTNDILQRFKNAYAEAGLPPDLQPPIQVIHPIPKPQSLVLIVSVILLVILISIFWNDLSDLSHSLFPTQAF